MFCLTSCHQETKASFLPSEGGGKTGVLTDSNRRKATPRVMNKKEYIQANREWMLAKAQEEGVKILSKGICYKLLMASNLTVAGEVFPWPFGSVI